MGGGGGGQQGDVSPPAAVSQHRDGNRVNVLPVRPRASERPRRPLPQTTMMPNVCCQNQYSPARGGGGGGGGAATEAGKKLSPKLKCPQEKRLGSQAEGRTLGSTVRRPAGCPLPLTQAPQGQPPWLCAPPPTTPGTQAPRMQVPAGWTWRSLNSDCVSQVSHLACGFVSAQNGF